MPILIEEDTTKPGGHAVITLGAVPAGADLRFSVRRLAGDPVNLGPQGWQNSEALLEASEIMDSGGTTVLLVGPEVCDHIADDTQIEISFPVINLQESLFWPYVAPSGRVTTGGGMGQAPAAPEPQPTPIVELEPESEPEPVPESEAAAEPDPEPKSEEEPKRETKDDPERDQDQDIRQDDEKKEEGRKAPAARLWLVLVPLLILGIGAGGYFWFFEEENGGDVVVENGKEKKDKADEDKKDKAGDDKKDKASEGKKDKDDSKTPPADPMKVLQKMAKANAAPKEFYEQGMKFLGSGHHDAAFRAISHAGTGGYAPALHQLGKWYDPDSFNSKIGIPKPNLATAAGYYKQAAEGGVADAQPSLEAVCTALKKTIAETTGDTTVAATKFEEVCKK